MAPSVTFCSILSSNYLPKALALADSLRRHEDGASLTILFIDIARDEDLPKLEGINSVSTASLGLDDRTILDLATGYDLVEFATALKPLLLKELLKETEQVYYLDPDTYLTSPMLELSDALAASDGGILLTPHFLFPAGQDSALNDGHMLLVGVYNLGFCGVDRRSIACLDWWWGHLRDECLSEPLSGLFVDQKWMDIGSTLFQAASFRHSGYNVGVGNLLERPIEKDDAGYYNAANGDRLRLFHFHAFDAKTPERLTVRFDHSSETLDEGTALFELCGEYAEVVRRYEASLPVAPAYPYWTDTRGRRLSQQLRRAFRVDSMAGQVPSPFVPAEADEFDAWRKKAWKVVARGLVADVAKSARVILPEETVRLRKKFPRVAGKFRSGLRDGVGMWR